MVRAVFINKRFLFQLEQITAEYKILALQHHPDKNDGDKEAEAMFQKLKVCILLLYLQLGQVPGRRPYFTSDLIQRCRGCEGYM